ncbi:MAG TPA: DUF4294 domain-containing protein, partial [Flavobacteriales bacterium]|nr:DUF4294 domain-containing protein [Flavobacteriales bacterium]
MAALRHSLTLLGSCTLLSLAHAQGPPALVPVIVEGADTIPVYMLADHEVDYNMSPSQRRRAEKLDKLTRNVIKVYPYARVTAQLLDEYERDMSAMASDKDRDLYMKLAEAELRAEFEEEVKSMTMSQGRVLIKLIDRETGHTSYDLVKQLRGSFQAWMWQGVAKIFGNDLKDDYDPQGDDVLVESIVRRIENGELATAPRAARTAKAQARLEKR